MKTNQLFRLVLFSVILLSLRLLAIAQAPPTPAPQPQATPMNVDVVYTGRLLGYFRVPSLQDFDAKGCPANGIPSKAADKFLKIRERQVDAKTVLVGTGDNFAPELEARVFSNLPPRQDKQYAIGNKELYYGSGDKWVFYKDAPDSLIKQIAEGNGTIPSDNVGCFLRRAGYAAIVPGKHDFYFGAERVREYARFLAANDPTGLYKPVQMLGANLVIKTTPIEGESVSSKIKAEHSFEDWPSGYPVLNLSDGKSVYPWFSVIKIKLLDISPKTKLMEELGARANRKGVLGTPYQFTTSLIPEIVKVLDTGKPEDAQNRVADKKKLATVQEKLASTPISSLRICKSGPDGNGNPNQLQALKDCDPPNRMEVRVSDNAILLYVYLKKIPVGNHPPTLEFAKNFGVCTEVKDPKDETKLKTACMRFSSYTPFFYFPHIAPNQDPGSYDPEPYVIKNDVAIFGIVDPALNEQVGILNLGFTHYDDPNLTARVSAEDAAEGLQQQLDYFETEHGDFSGVKVLLAQMPPARARKLVALFPEFQIVVSAADQEQATSNVTMSTSWKPGAPSAGTFLAVPTPYFNTSTRKGSVHLGIINATSDDDLNSQTRTWKLNANAQPGQFVDEPEDSADLFWDRIKQLPGCIDSHFPRKQPEEHYDNVDYLKWLTLCTMQQYLGADVAMIQSRDMFDKILKLDEATKDLYLNRAKASPKEAETTDNVQQILDRLIWKGDLIILLHVPGSAIKKALAQSDRFEEEEKSTLSLAAESGRKLETLGIRKEKGEYFINEQPIDDNRIYAVATTDYIEAGDTGYPDLVQAARNPRPTPASFKGDLVSISSLVCRKFFDNNSEKIKQYCLPAVDSDDYLDQITAKQIPPYPSERWFTKFWKATGIAWPHERTLTNSPQDGLEQKVQRRSFWGFSLKNFSIGFNDLDNNRTDQSLKDKFAGISTPGLNSKENRTISFGLDTRLSYFADKQEFFIGTGADYERKSTGDPPSPFGISQNKNRLYGDLGLVLWRRPGREFPNLGPVFSMRAETQIEQPFSTFTLNTSTSDQIRITQKRGLLLLGRLGMRWQSKLNIFEVGGQFGRQMRALRGYQFENPGGIDVECLVSSAQTVDGCITEKSTPSNGGITASSIPSALLQGRPRAGMYWNHSLSFPIGSKVKYEVTQDADFFFVNFHRDTTIDTRFRYNSKNTLSFMIWPNFSIGPSLGLFMYQNKVNRNFLFQRTLGIETKLNFDIFNRREKKAQIISRR